MFTLAVCMAVGALGLSVVNLTGSHTAVLVYALLSSAVLSSLTFVLLPATLAKVWPQCPSEASAMLVGMHGL
jgi:hypothetical protein